jgi:hypothetical protein
MTHDSSAASRPSRMPDLSQLFDHLISPRATTGSIRSTPLCVPVRGITVYIILGRWLHPSPEELLQAIAVLARGRPVPSVGDEAAHRAL